MTSAIKINNNLYRYKQISINKADLNYSDNISEIYNNSIESKDQFKLLEDYSNDIKNHINYNEENINKINNLSDFFYFLFIISTLLGIFLLISTSIFASWFSVSTTTLYFIVMSCFAFPALFYLINQVIVSAIEPNLNYEIILLEIIQSGEPSIKQIRLFNEAKGNKSI